MTSTHHDPAPPLGAVSRHVLTHGTTPVVTVRQTQLVRSGLVDAASTVQSS